MKETTSLGAWVLASRPKTLPAAVAPVLVGTACAKQADGLFLPAALAALVGAVLIQIGANFANDLYDFKYGADADDRLGPTRAVQSGTITASAMTVGIAVVFTLAIAVGSYLVSLTGWPIVVVGIASILAAIAYTAGPYPLGYNGLGEVFVILFFGFVAVCGTCDVQVGRITSLALICSLNPGAMAAAILVVNNVRDAETDAPSGKRTLAVRFGTGVGKIEYVALILVAYAVPAVVSAEIPWAFLPLLSTPLGVVVTRKVLRADSGPLYNRSLAATGGLMLVQGFLLAFGIGLGD